MASTDKNNYGVVYLVGAGPGDAGLVTVWAVECLGRADLVLYDYLVNPAILDCASPSAELLCLGHHRTGRVVSQEEINERMVDAARQGKTVVRLKGGDPAVFACTAEEATAVRKAGIKLEIVPGITTAMAIAAYAAIPIIHGGPSGSAVALVAGQQRHGKGPGRLDYATLAGFPGTLVFYMGVTSARQWSRALLEPGHGRSGKSPQTPVAVVRRCSWPDQRTVRCTLGTVAEVIAEEGIRPPAVVVVGNVMDTAQRPSWFAARPLFGVRVLVTRPRDGANALRARLGELGAEVLVQPAIQISDPPDWQPVDAALDRLDQYDWLVFSSAHGVRYLLDRLLDGGRDLRRLSGIKLAAVGPGTARQLARYNLRADLLPKQYRAESLAEALTPHVRGRRLLLPRASRGRQVLAEMLEHAGAAVDQIVAYSSTDVERAEPGVVAALSDGRIDWITVTSSAIARSMVKLFGDDLRQSKLAAISPITSEVLRELGHRPAVEARPHTMDGLLAAIENG